MAESEEELKKLLMKVKEKSEQASLKLNIQKRRSYHLVSHFMAHRWVEIDRLFSWAPKSLLTVTAATKLTNTCSLEEKLCPT